MPEDAYDSDAIRFLADIEPPKRDPNDPVVLWVKEFLDDPRARPGRIVVSLKSLPDSVVARLQVIADEYPDAAYVVAGGLSGEPGE